MPCFLCKCFFSSFLFLPVWATHAQVRIEPAATGIKGESTNYIVYGAYELNNRIPYSKIKGSSFWNSDFDLATIYSDNKILGIVPAKLNLVTNELHFYSISNKELVLTGSPVSKIVFHKNNDTSTTSAVFLGQVENLVAGKKPVNKLVQQLNEGKYQLLKFTERQLKSADSLFGTQKRYFFADDVYYFMRFNEKVERIKKLNRENMLQFLPSTTSYTGWIEKNKIDFKKEADAVRFLNYYNAGNTRGKVK